MQIDDPGIATRLQRRIELRHQGAYAQPLRRVAADQDAVRALVGHHLERAALLHVPAARIEGVQCAHHVRCRSVLQRHHIDILVPDPVDAVDDGHHPMHVARPVGDDEDVGRRVGGEMTVLRDHRPQDRHQLRRAHVLDGNDLGDDLIRGGADTGGEVDGGVLPGVRIGHDLLDVVPCRHRDEAVDLEDREECLIEGGRRHRRRGVHRHLRAHPRVEDEALARCRGDSLDDLSDVRVLEVRRDAHGLVHRARRLCLRLAGERRREQSQTACECEKAFH